MLNYMKPRGTRKEHRTLAGRFRGGKLSPIMAVPFRESEGGVVDQVVYLELDPIAGRVITPMMMDVTCVYVPALAADVVKNADDEDYVGYAEEFREKLLSSTPVFDLEEEGEVTKRLGINPVSIDGTKYVNEIIRLSHIAAVNYLRRRKYVNATQLDNDHDAVTPALIGQTVLDRLNAVLDPEDRINGAVDIGGTVNVSGADGYVDFLARTDKGLTIDTSFSDGTDPTGTLKEVVAGDETPRVDLSGLQAELSGGTFSTHEFFLAEKMDRLVRQLRVIIDNNPELGEDYVARIAHGLSIEAGKQPFVVYQKTLELNRSAERAMDGASLGTVLNTQVLGGVNFTVPIPSTEFGGVLLTFASLKPDESLAAQPHPVASDVWAGRNYIADEMALDPVPVTIRQVYSDCDQADESTVVCWVGNNSMLRNYAAYGFNRHIDPETVESLSSIWTLDVPMSVTPESVIYPADIDHYPFADQDAEVARYTVVSNARIASPIIFGPTPIEELASIESLDIFDDAPEE